ncbi:hypothetical protein ACFYSJ_31635 [Streptomyces sp. NPDC005248]|uniref:hypothetical protein n=1 Tax=unclassified Streptomyces TaxID=2593676 RepID=UPI0033A741DE
MGPRLTHAHWLGTVEVLSTADFPDTRVCRDTGRVELRLITHGGCTTANGHDAGVVFLARLVATL